MLTLRLTDPAWWRERVPELSVTDEGAPLMGGPADPDVSRQIERLRTEGIVSFDGAVDLALGEALLTGVETLRRSGLPVIFLIVFDEFWDLIAGFDGTCRALLGDYRVMSKIWVWHVDASKGEAGWPAHREALVDEGWDPEDPVRTVGFWVPLSEVTPDNGPIFVLPANLDPGIPNQIRIGREDLQNVRLLLAQPGSLLGWHQSVLHWGARATPDARVSRVSLSWEVSTPKAKEWPGEGTWTGRRPRFTERVRLAALQILQYNKFHDLEKNWLVAAYNLLDRIPPEGGGG